MVNEFVATSEGVKNVDPSLDWKGNGAICISGLPRFPQAYESLMSLKTHLENTNPNATFDWYFYLWDLPDDRKEWMEWIRQTFNPVALKIAQIPTFDSDLNKRAFNGVRNRLTPFSAHKVKPENIYCMYNAIYECNKLIEKDYDVVIRSRTDLIYSAAGLYLGSNQYCFGEEWGGGHIVLPNNTQQWAYKGSATGVEHAYNDQFAIANQKNMNKYAECFNLLDHLILAETGRKIPISSESILHRHITNQEIPAQLVPIFTYFNIMEKQE